MSCWFPFGDVLKPDYNRSRPAPHKVEAVLADVTDRLKEWLPDLGDEVAVDSTAVRAHSNPNRKHVSDSDAEWGVKNSAKAKEGGTEYTSSASKSTWSPTPPTAFPWPQVVTAGNRSDSPVLPDVMKQAEVLYDWWKPKPKPRWDAHLPGVVIPAGCLSGVIRPLIAGLSGSAVSPRLSGWSARPGICRPSHALPPCFPGTDCQWPPLSSNPRQSHRR